MTSRLPHALLLVSALTACTGETAPPQDGPDLDLATARARAVELGTFLQPIIAGVGEHVTMGRETDGEPADINIAALTEWFGDRVSSVATADGQRFAETFVLGAATEESRDGAVSIDGRAVLLVWSIAGGPGFFYEPTVVDTRTGALYQGFTDIGKLPVDRWIFFGPLQPPSAARVTGHFDADGLWDLYTSIREGVFGGADSQ